MLRDLVDDEARGDRRAVVVQDRDQARRVEPASLTSSVLQLRIAVLLDHEHPRMRRDEIVDLVLEREAAHPQRVDMNASLGEHVQRFVHRRAGRAVEDRAEARRLFGRIQQRFRNERLGRLELLQQALHVVDVVRARLRCSARSGPSWCRA